MKIRLIIPLLLAVFALPAFAEPSSSVKLGAYYFDGWTGKTRHITAKLQSEFPERRPVWGWVTSTPEVMRAQIETAAEAGLQFFTFDWYYSDANRRGGDDPKNNALKLFLAAPNHSHMQFNILVVNHQGYDVRPADWEAMSKIWLTLMKDPSYLKADGKPLLVFFAPSHLVDTFGSAQAVHDAMEKLRAAARAEGIGEIALAACAGPGKKSLALMHQIGFDILTNYNYHGAAFDKTAPPAAVPLDNLTAKEPSIWDGYLATDMPYIPVSTLAFDSRPQSDVYADAKSSSWYTGFSPDSVYKSISTLKSWMEAHSGRLTRDKLAIVYAWNENREGAWLTPTAPLQNKLLESVTRALK